MVERGRGGHGSENKGEILRETERKGSERKESGRKRRNWKGGDGSIEREREKANKG